MEIVQIKAEPLDFCNEESEKDFDYVVFKEEDVKTERVEAEYYFEITPDNILVTSPRTDGFLHLNNVTVDELTFDSKEVLQCDKCQISYSNKASFKNHVNVCKRPQIRQGLQTIYNRMYREDRTETVGEKMKRSIKILERSCFKDEHLDDDNDESTKGGVFECADCEECFCGVRRFARHAYAHTFVKQAPDDLPHICADCGEEFCSKHLADGHVSTAANACLSVPRLFFPCVVCRKSFTRKDNLREHLRGHAGRPTHRKRYECSFCRRMFGGVSLLTIHMRTHVAEAKFTCTTCRKTFSSNLSLKKHIRSHSAGK
jgi:hypothetical protein